mmetsp:Transcript_11389/g.12506  ORF Transcript_11389/g.12506 Transcript_11389/m.12506 type:complete len:457 (+) Transcript_11389:110-1480(+)
MTTLGGPPNFNADKQRQKKKRYPKKRLPSPDSFVVKTQKDATLDVSEDEEDEEDYRKGGYHPIQLEDTFKAGRYVVKAKLGWGHFSTVWLADDHNRNMEVALKIVKSARHYTEAARDEIEILTEVKKRDADNKRCIIRLHDSFDIVGPHGKHVCMVFEKLGANMLSLIRLYKYRGLPLPMVKLFTKQILIGLDYLHRECKIIHTDLKPENVLLEKTPVFQPRAKHDEEASDDSNRSKSDDKMDTDDRNRNGHSRRSNDSLPRSSSELMDAFGNGSWRAKIVDLGNACWTHKHFTDDVQTRQYRAPEVILGHSYDTAIDMWSMACIVFELLTGDLLFEPRMGKNFTKNDDHLAQIIELLGAMPKRLSLGGRYSNDYFNSKGELRSIKTLKFWGLQQVAMEKYKFSPGVAESVSDFLLNLLVYDPKKRWTARQCLDHPWLKDVDISDFKSVLVADDAS